MIPYESLDPLTIGASGDDDKVSRDTLELEIPDGNLLAAIYPDEPAPVADATEAARAALEAPIVGPRFSELIASASKVCVIIDNQFRPTPQSKLLPPVLDAIEAAGKPAVVVCANGKVFPMSDSDIDQKIGKENLARMERLGIAFHQNDPRNTDNYEYVGVSSRGTPVWLHKEVAACDVKITIGQAQSNHWGAGGGGKLILPGVVSDETIESNHCAFVPSPQTHYGAYAGPMRSDIDEVATMCGLSCDDERRPRHARPRDRVHVRRRTPTRTARRSSASTRSTRTSTPGRRRTSRSAACSHRPTTSSSTRAGAACPPTSWSRTAARSSTARRHPASRRRSATSRASRSWIS